MDGAGAGKATGKLTATEAESFGELLRRHRLAAGLTQEGLAERAGLSVRAITDLERGARRAPYRDTVRTLADALGLEAGDRTALEASARRPRGGVPRSPGPAWPLAELPSPLTPLVGRERAIAEAVRLLRRSDVRLLALAGPGGVGKTRLAIEVAATLRLDFMEGAAFVPLSALSDPDLVLPTIARSLGIAEAGGRAVSRTLADALRTKHLLLVLDNVEHLLAAAPAIADLLFACPRLNVLATGRAAPGISGEHRLAVPPLALPDADGPLAPAALRRYAAVELFCQRAEAAHPAFDLTDEAAPTVAAIVRHLDGLPLAIELAAARTRLLGPQALLARLTGARGGASLRLLTGGGRDLPPRQQTLRDTIRWSHDLLSDGEQRLFRRLAIFAGGWTLEAAEAICDLAGDLGVDLLAGLDALTEQSLLQREDGAHGEPRFTMLSTILEFAREQLDLSGDAPTMRERHGRYFFEEVRDAVPQMPLSTWVVDWRRLLADLENVRAALAWSRALPDGGATELELAGSLAQFWHGQSLLGEGRRWLADALERSEGSASAVERARALQGAALLAWSDGDFDAAEAFAEEALGAYRALGDDAGAATVLTWLVYVALERRDEPARIRALVAEAASIQDAAYSDVGMIREAEGRLALQDGDLAAARAHYEASVSAARADAGPSRLGFIVRQLGYVVQEQGDLSGAAALFAESVALNRGTGEDRGMIAAVAALAGLLAAQRRSVEAARLCGAAAAGLERIGVSSLLYFDQERWEGTCDALRGSLGAAAFDAAWTEGRAIPLADAIAMAVDQPSAS